jgi:hypothetical protein
MPDPNAIRIKVAAAATNAPAIIAGQEAADLAGTDVLPADIAASGVRICSTKFS